MPATRSERPGVDRGTIIVSHRMPTFVVLLGSMNARVQPWGSTDLQVSLEVEAPDIGAALTSAKELVADPLGAEPQIAHVGLKGFRVDRSSIWRRWGRRVS